MNHSGLLERLQTHWNPHIETCGVILLTGEVVKLPNLSRTPSETFEMDLSAISGEVIATWHTHPTQGPNLSTPDYLLFLQYPHLWHYIVGGPTTVWAYYVEDSRVLLYDEDSDQA